MRNRDYFAKPIQGGRSTPTYGHTCLQSDGSSGSWGAVVLLPVLVFAGLFVLAAML